ncbi:type II toxin-antitoxin system HicB family antitoxin [Mesorhizobium sp. RCC_202]|uniref:type II toxin-antitoxin system HicB family antitoxin n=1 Tax=Mesorhizobium sp. RCC_202 TaxID=3239222 RepID=UPI00352578B7
MKAAHRQTLDKIFANPVSASTKWRDVEALLIALGARVVGRTRLAGPIHVERDNASSASTASIARYESICDPRDQDFPDRFRCRTMKPYKGYLGTIEFDETDVVFHGRIVGIRDIFTYEADSAEELLKAFHGCVDDYLEFCAEQNKEPEKPFSGKLALRTTPEVHRLVSRAASSDGKSINQWVSDTLAEAARKRIDEGSTKVTSRAH